MSENYVNRVVDQESNIYGIQDYRLPIPEEQDENKVVSVYEGQYALRELDMSNYYNKDQTDGLLAAKANADEVYRKDEVYTKAEVYTKNEVDTELVNKVDVAALDDYYTKKDTDIILDDRGFIVCSSEAEMADLVIPENIGKYIKFTDESSSRYEAGQIYSIKSNNNGDIPDYDHPENTWSNRNLDFDDLRDSLQQNYSTEIPLEVLGKGRIDVEQTIDLTSPDAASWAWGTDSTANPRVISVANDQSDSVFINKSLEDGDLGTIAAVSQWSIFPIDSRVEKNLTSDFGYRPSGSNGIILGTAINRNACVEPSDRSSLENLQSNIRGIHTIKIDENTKRSICKLGVQLFGYIRCNSEELNLRRWNNGSLNHNIYGSVWLRYTNNNNEEVVAKISGSESRLNLASASTSTMIIDQQITSPSNGSRTAQTEGYGYTTNNIIDVELPLANALSIDGVKTFEVIEVLEAYKDQNADLYLLSSAQNDVELLAWAAFTDLQVITAAPSISFKLFAKNRENSDNVFLANTYDEGYTNRFSVSASDLPSIRLLNNSVLLNVVIQNLKLNSDSDRIVDWRGFATRDGISGIAYTEAGNREDIIVRILQSERVELIIRNESGELETIDEDQSIKVRRLI